MASQLKNLEYEERNQKEKVGKQLIQKQNMTNTQIPTHSEKKTMIKFQLPQLTTIRISREDRDINNKEEV